MYMYVFVCVCVCMYAYMYICICMYMYMYVYIYLYIYIVIKFLTFISLKLKLYSLTFYCNLNFIIFNYSFGCLFISDNASAIRRPPVELNCSFIDQILYITFIFVQCNFMGLNKDCFVLF